VKTLRDKAIVITGAGGTLAGAVEEALVEDGARPILIDRDAVRIRARAQSFGTLAIEENLLTRESAERAAQAALQRMGRIDGLIHLVGDVIAGRLEDAAPEDFDAVFDSHVRTLFHTLQAFLPHLRAQPEAFIAGLGARQAFHGGLPGATLFAAAKGAGANLLRSLDAELAGSNVTVSIITPLGNVDSPTSRAKLPTFGPENWITPAAIGRAFRAAALSGAGGRQLEIPVHPPR